MCVVQHVSGASTPIISVVGRGLAGLAGQTTTNNAATTTLQQKTKGW